MKLTCVPSHIRKVLKHEILDDKETRRLVKLAQGGACKALETLVVHNQRLIFSIAVKIWCITKTLGIEDLMQEGNIGFIHVISKYNPNNVAKLSTYARKGIRGRILFAVSSQDRTVRYPSDLYGLMKKVQEAILMLTEKHGERPPESLILKKVRLKNTNRNPKSILALLSARTVSLEEAFSPSNTNDQRTIESTLVSNSVLSPVESLVAQEDLAEMIGKVRAVIRGVDLLSVRGCYKDIFYMHFGFRGHNSTGMPEIAKRSGVSKQAIGFQLKDIWERLDPNLSIRDSKALRLELLGIGILSEVIHEDMVSI